MEESQGKLLYKPYIYSEYLWVFSLLSSRITSYFWYTPKGLTARPWKMVFGRLSHWVSVYFQGLWLCSTSGGYLPWTFRKHSSCWRLVPEFSVKLVCLNRGLRASKQTNLQTLDYWLKRCSPFPKKPGNRHILPSSFFGVGWKIMEDSWHSFGWIYQECRDITGVIIITNPNNALP